MYSICIFPLLFISNAPFNKFITFYKKVKHMSINNKYYSTRI